MPWGPRNQRFAVIGHDAWGRAIVGAPVPVGSPTLFGSPGAPAMPAPGTNTMTPAQAAAVLAAYGITPNAAGNLSLPVSVLEQNPSMNPYVPGGALPVFLPPSSTLVPASGAGAAPNPSWRDGQIAPGVETPQEGMVPLPMNPQSNGGIFSATVTQITFQGQLQKPYRAERLLIQVGRTGTSATNAFVTGQIFVGTDLQQGDITPILLEPLGNSNAFGTRLTLMQAPPGVLIRIITSLTAALAGSDTIAVSMQWLGRIIH